MLLGTVQHLAEKFGIPLAADKTEGPKSELVFLDITIDSMAMECRLHEDKVVSLREEVSRAVVRKKLCLKELRTLLGKRNFACRIIPMGRIFCRRLAAATAGVKVPNHFIRLTRELQADLKVWDAFLECFNGRSMWQTGPVSNADLELFTDAAGSAGYGAYCRGRWCAGPWPDSWREAGFLCNLVLLELFPIVLAVELWGGRITEQESSF